MHIHYLQHVHFEDLGNIAPWALDRGHTVTRTRFHERERLPDPSDIDWVIVLGGPMNVYEEDRFPWLAREKIFIERAIEAGKRVLGVCLGAQLIADALGGEITRNPEAEIGWFPVHRTPASVEFPAFRALPQTIHAFHWHGDTFSIPPGATHLAASDACPNQAFGFEDHVLALQFHLESSAHGVSRLLRHCADDLCEGPYVQTPETIRTGCDMHLATLQSLLEAFLDAMEQLNC